MVLCSIGSILAPEDFLMGIRYASLLWCSSHLVNLASSVSSGNVRVSKRRLSKLQRYCKVRSAPHIAFMNVSPFFIWTLKEVIYCFYIQPLMFIDSLRLDVFNIPVFLSFLCCISGNHLYVNVTETFLNLLFRKRR